MKTALDLLGEDECTRSECYTSPWCRHDAELVAQRAREEMREMAAVAAEGVTSEDGGRCALGPDDCERCEYEANVAARIRTLKVKP